MLFGFGAALLVASRLPYLRQIFGTGEMKGVLIGATIVCLRRGDRRHPRAGLADQAGRAGARRRGDGLPGGAAAAAAGLRGDGAAGAGAGGADHPHRAHLDQRGELHRRPRRPRGGGGRHRGAGVLRLHLPAVQDLRPAQRLLLGHLHHRCAGRRAAWASCRTTSTRPGCSWATPARCCSGCCWPPRRSRSPAASTPAPALSGNTAVAIFLPIVVPLAILTLPLLDVLLAVVRRTRAGMRPWHPDAGHLHHRMLKIGHTHRRAVLLLYLWAALLAMGAVSFAYVDGWLPIVVIAVDRRDGGRADGGPAEVETLRPLVIPFTSIHRKPTGSLPDARRAPSRDAQTTPTIRQDPP